jgi:dethiobiotin synthetase
MTAGRRLLILGSGTDVGKTWVTCRLLERLRKDGVRVDVRKPVVSGFDEERREESDPALLARAAGLCASGPLDDATLARISPHRLRAPLAPDEAARREGRPLTLAALCHSSGDATAPLCLIETAGGVMSPVAEDGTVVDWVALLGAPCVVVVGAHLGAITHGLCALAVCRQRALPVAAVVVNGADDDALRPYQRFAAPHHAASTAWLAIPRDATADHPAVARLATATRMVCALAER